MGHPVVHFEIVGKDGDKLQSYYAELFDWDINADNEMRYGLVQREGNTNSDGIGIGGGVSTGPEGYDGQSRSTSRCPTSKPPSLRPRASAERG
jgi:uncharacterized protein